MAKKMDELEIYRRGMVNLSPSVLLKIIKFGNPLMHEMFNSN